MAEITPTERSHWPDNAKAIGILLVYHGHVLEHCATADNGALLRQLQFIYSFHLPLFFLLSGLFFKIRPVTFLTALKTRALRRLVPVLFFAALLFPLWIAFQWLTLQRVDWGELRWRTLDYLRGEPSLDLPTWFLVCLFTTEMLAALVIPRLRTPVRILPVAAGTMAAGLVLSDQWRSAVDVIGIPKTTWFALEALVAFGLYALGFVSAPGLRKAASRHGLVKLSLGLAFLGLALLTYAWNSPNGAHSRVMMVYSQHGQPFLFLLTAAAGTLAVLFISMCVPGNRIADYLGRHALILLGLSGIFDHFLNAWLVTRWVPAHGVKEMTARCALIAVASLAVAAPFAWLIRAYAPQFVGAGGIRGPAPTPRRESPS